MKKEIAKTQNKRPTPIIKGATKPPRKK